jgi:hypothetical protein
LCIRRHLFSWTNGRCTRTVGCRASRANKLQTPDATETFEDCKDFDSVLMPVKATSREGDDLAITLITPVTYDDLKD